MRALKPLTLFCMLMTGALNANAFVDFESFSKSVIDLDGDFVFRPGDRVQYRLEIENTGDEVAQNIVIRDPIPSALFNVSVQDGGSVQGAEVVWTRTQLPPGARVTLRFEASLRTPLDNNIRIENQARLSADTIDDVFSDDILTPTPNDPTAFFVESSADFSFSKSVSDQNDAPLVPGDFITYALTFENTGDALARNVNISDPIDENLENIAASDGGIVNGQNIQWSLGDVPPGVERTLTISARTLSGLDNGTIIENRATLFHDEGVTLSDDPSTPMQDATRIRIVSAADFSSSTLESVDENGLPIERTTPGAIYFYEINLRNSGTANAANAIVRMPIPAGSSVSGAAGGRVENQTLIFDAQNTPALANVGPAQEVALLVLMRVDTPLANQSVLQSQLLISADGFALADLSDDPSTAFAADPTTVTVDSAANFSRFEKTFVSSGAQANVVEPGDEVQYVLTLENSGNDFARRVLVRDPLPANTEFVRSIDGGRVFGNQVVFESFRIPPLLEVAPGVLTLRFTVRVLENTPNNTQIDNIALASADNVAPLLSDDPTTPQPDDPTSFVVESLPKLSIDKRLFTPDGTRTVSPGDVLRYEFNLESSGSRPTENARFIDILPQGVDAVVADPPLVFDAQTRTLSADLAPLAPGESLRFVAQMLVAEDAIDNTLIENQAQVLEPTLGVVVSNDPDTPEELDKTIARVVAFPELTTSTKAARDLNGGLFSPADEVVFDIAVKNSGRGRAQDIRVSDVIDTQNLNVLEVLNQGTLAGDTVQWDGAAEPRLQTLAPGEEVVLSVRTEIKKGTPDLTRIENQGFLVARSLNTPIPTDDESTEAPDDATAFVVNTPVLSFTKTLIDDNGAALLPGDNVTYRFVVENSGSGFASNIEITDALPIVLKNAVAQNGTISEGVARFSIASIAPGARAEVVLNAVIDPLALNDTLVENQAELSAGELLLPILSDDPTTPEAQDKTSARVVAEERYAGTVTLRDAASDELLERAIPGQSVRVQIEFENTGTQTGRAIILRVPFDSRLFSLEDADNGGIIDRVAGVAIFNASQSGAFEFIAPGETRELNLIGRVASQIEDGIEVSVLSRLISATSDDEFVFGPARFFVDSSPDLSATTLRVTDENGGITEPGDFLRYDLEVINRGGRLAPNVLVTNPTPAGTVYVSQSALIDGLAVEDTGLNPFTRPFDLGDIDAGRSVRVSYRVRVALESARGFELSNQAFCDVESIRFSSDDPDTLVKNDATRVVVGGGPLLTLEKSVSQQSASTGDALRWTLRAENVGSDRALNVVVEDALESAGTFVSGSLTVDGQPVSDASGDGLFIAQNTVRSDPFLLEARESKTFSFLTLKENQSTTLNQANIRATGIARRLSDADPTIAGAQPTRVQNVNSQEAQIASQALTLTDENGGLLAAGDNLVGHVLIKNAGASPLTLNQIAVNIGALFELDTAALDERLTFDASTRFVEFVPQTEIVLNANESVAFDLRGTLNEVARVGDGVAIDGRAFVAENDIEYELGRASLVSGLLDGSARVGGVLYLDNGERNDAFDSDDIRASGFQVLAFSEARENNEAVRSAVTNERGGYVLSPLPLGQYVIEVRSSSGALYGRYAITLEESGEVRSFDIRLTPNGALYFGEEKKPAPGVRAFLYVDDGDFDISNDNLVSDTLLPEGQQGQLTSAQGYYRFDPPAGRYRLGFEPPSALLGFPSINTPAQNSAEGAAHPLGDVYTGNSGVVPSASPQPSEEALYFLRFTQPEGAEALNLLGEPVLFNNHVALDDTREEVRINKSSSRRQASVGDVIAYTVRVQNNTNASVPLSEGGVEIVDTLPEGFRLLEDKWSLDEVTLSGEGERAKTRLEVEQEGTRVSRFGPFALEPRREYILRYNVVIGPKSKLAEATNRAVMRLAEGEVPLTQVAAAKVQVIQDAVFDLSSVRGRIFCDDNRDGRLNEGEKGLYGARIYLDTGHYSEADIDGKFHFSFVPPGNHLAKVDTRTLPPKTSLKEQSALFYVTRGTPAAFDFAATCALEKVAPAEFAINPKAYDFSQKAENAKAQVHVVVSEENAQVSIDGKVLTAPKASLGVSVNTQVAQGFDGPGINLHADESGALKTPIVFWPRLSGQHQSASWRLVIQSNASAGDETTSRLLYVFAGSGPLPDKIVWNGKDKESSNNVITKHRRYDAVLQVFSEEGVYVSSATRPLALAYGAQQEPTPSETLKASLDETKGALFLRGDKASKRLDTFVSDFVKKVQAVDEDAEVIVRVHTSPDDKAPFANTNQKAKTLSKLLAQAGIKRIDAKGAGDVLPVVANVRRRDRRQNRRVELSLKSKEPDYEEILPTEWSSEVTLDGQPFAANEKGIVDTTISVEKEGHLDLHIKSKDGSSRRQVIKISDDSHEPSAAEKKLKISGSFEEERFMLANKEAKVKGLGSALVATSVNAEGVVWVRSENNEAQVSLEPIIDPSLAVASWRVRFIQPRDDALPSAQKEGVQNDVVRDVILKELEGKGAPPSRIEWRGQNAEGAQTLAQGDRFSARLILDLENGDVIIAKDLNLEVESPQKAPPGEVAAGIGGEVEDASVDSGALRRSVRKDIDALLKSIFEVRKRDAFSGARLRIEAHTDDAGSEVAQKGRSARLMKDVVARAQKAGFEASDIEQVLALGARPKVPNIDSKMRKKNRRVTLSLVRPEALKATKVERRVVVFGQEIEVKEDGTFSGELDESNEGEWSLMLRAQNGVRAMVRARASGEVEYEGPASGLIAKDAQQKLAVNSKSSEPAENKVPREGVAIAYKGEGDAPAWWPMRADVPASKLIVELPDDGTRLRFKKLLVRGRAAPENRVEINGEKIVVDSQSGVFAHVVTLPEGESELLVQAKDPMGNVSSLRRKLVVDEYSWFVMAMADTAIGQEGAKLHERSAYNSTSLYNAFVFGRGVLYAKGAMKGGTLFSDYEATLHIDTSRIEEVVFARDLENPSLALPIWGDSSVQVQDAKSRFPIYAKVKADASELTVGNIALKFDEAGFFKYTRSRFGAHIHFDRGWEQGLKANKGDVKKIQNDKWRTRGDAFFAAGDAGQRHARVELLGTGGSVYFLRHQELLEGSERVALIVRDAITGAEIARKALVRNQDYTTRYAEGRVIIKEPVPAFTDMTFSVNHNLGQVSSGHRVYVEVEYDHQSQEVFSGLSGGGHLSQRYFGHFEMGAGYLYEARPDGAPAYQLGDVSAKLYLDEDTFVAAEVAFSRSVDASNFTSFDGGLTYRDLGQSFDQQPTLLEGRVQSTERQGIAYKVHGQLAFGEWLNKSKRDALVRAYFQHQDAGFFAGATIVEQGQTKWGTEASLQITKADRLRLRYDGTVSQIASQPHVDDFRTLERQIATLRYERKILPTLSAHAEYGFSYTNDSGQFNAAPGDDSRRRQFAAHVGAVGAEYRLLDRLTLALRQEAIVGGDEVQMASVGDRFVTHLDGRYKLTEKLSLNAGGSLRWSGENQARVGLSYQISEKSRLYANDRFGFSRSGFTNTQVVGGEAQLSSVSNVYAEYQLQSAFNNEQSRGVVGVNNHLKLPYGFALDFGYERTQTLGGQTSLTENQTLPPGALTDGTFFGAPGQNGGGDFFYGSGARDAASVALHYKQKEKVNASQRFELRYDNFDEARGGRDRIWFMSRTNATIRFSSEWSLLARYNIGLAQDLGRSKLEAYIEDGSLGLAYRPVTHDWASVLFKIARRVEMRPLGVNAGLTENLRLHVATIEPIVELPYNFQLVSKLALKHSGLKLDDLDAANAFTTLSTLRLNWRAMRALNQLDLGFGVPGDIDFGIEYRALAGISAQSVEHGTLLEIQYAPVRHFRFGVGYNFTHFSDQLLSDDERDHSGFFLRAVGTY